MSDDMRKPRLTTEGARRAETRQDRLAKALRENLMKRKTQQRAREAGAAASPGVIDRDAER